LPFFLENFSIVLDIFSYKNQKTDLIDDFSLYSNNIIIWIFGNKKSICLPY